MLLHVTIRSPHFCLITQLRKCSFDTEALSRQCVVARAHSSFSKHQSGEDSRAVTCSITRLCKRQSCSWQVSGGVKAVKLWGGQVKPHQNLIGSCGTIYQLKKGCWVDHDREKSGFFGTPNQEKKKDNAGIWEFSVKTSKSSRVLLITTAGTETGSLSKREASINLLGVTWIIYDSTCITQLNSQIQVLCVCIHVPGTTQHSVYFFCTIIDI